MRAVFYLLFLALLNLGVQAEQFTLSGGYTIYSWDESDEEVTGTTEQHRIKLHDCNKVMPVHGSLTARDCSKLCFSDIWNDRKLFIMFCMFTPPAFTYADRRLLEAKPSVDAVVPNKRPRFSTINSIPCNRFVARSSNYTNKGCFSACEKIKQRAKNPFRNSLFAERCVYQHWALDKIKDEVVVDDLCFSNIVYGYEDTAAVLKVGYASRYVETPAECMALCQHDRRCVYWLFTINPTASATETAGTKSLCHLKNQQMIEEALNTKIIDPETAVDGNACPVEMPSLCFSGARDCLKCCDDHTYTCAYRSPRHITGWKYCQPMDECNPEFCLLKPQTISSSTTKSPGRSSVPVTGTTTLDTTRPSKCKCKKKCCCDETEQESSDEKQRREEVINVAESHEAVSD